MKKLGDMTLHEDIDNKVRNQTEEGGSEGNVFK